MKLFDCQYFNKLCSHPFDKTMLTSAYSRYNDLNDPLRVNLFALILRELIRKIMQRESPDDQIKKTIWFQQYWKNNPNEQKVSRRDRYRYAISGYIDDSVTRLNASLDISDEIDGLAREINLLSKYAHFEKVIAYENNPKLYLDDLQNVESVVSNYSHKFFTFQNELFTVILDLVRDDFDSILEKRIERMLKGGGQILSSFDFQLTEFSEINVKKDKCTVSFWGIALIYYWSQDEYDDDSEFDLLSELDNDPAEIERKTEINVSSEFVLDIASLSISNINIEI